MAPVVQTAAHWPQPTHFVSESFLSKAGMTCRSLPRQAKLRMPCPCSSSHTRTQSPQRMHLFGSRKMAWLVLSVAKRGRVSGKRMCRTPKRWASSCRRQLPLLPQVVQLQSCEASSSSRIRRRCCSRREVFVRISSPSRGSMEQEASILPVFTSSTMHMRHAP